MLKYRLGYLIVIALACIGTVGTLASTASAANCTSVYGSTIAYVSNQWQWEGRVDSCTGVNEVEFATGFINDETRETRHSSVGTGGIAKSPNFPANAVGTYYATYINSVWGSGCGAPAFYVSKHFYFRIHNSSGGGSWGLWHEGISNQWLC